MRPPTPDRNPPLNRIAALHQTADCAVRHFDHPPGQPHQDPEREVAEGWGIAFVRAGAFGVEVHGVRERLVAGSVFLTRPGLAYRCAHDGPCPDDVCLAVGFAPEAVAGSEDAWTRAGWAARRVPTPRLAYVQRRLAGAARAQDAFELERWALAGLAALAADASRCRGRGPYAPRRADLDAVTAACQAIEADPVARRSIADRARAVGCTGPGLTHAFRRYLGLSPHQYVVRWRLADAAARLDQGATVSEGCWRSGFENLSHFCRAFQRAFGTRASQWRSLPLPERRRKVQALLRGRP
ncbi:MAG: helix-turn-helix transcriptional regulator [Gemmatimonadales bacterium]|nr:helix-turn-helix transcriptional regulator [Gemmatimonadota bacterium]MBP6670406.1 helix-turn-helix transcriptional regulator [Gemmatimonadales bacterium]